MNGTKLRLFSVNIWAHFVPYYEIVRDEKQSLTSSWFSPPYAASQTTLFASKTDR